MPDTAQTQTQDMPGTSGVEFNSRPSNQSERTENNYTGMQRSILHDYTSPGHPKLPIALRTHPSRTRRWRQTHLEECCTTWFKNTHKWCEKREKEGMIPRATDLCFLLGAQLAQLAPHTHLQIDLHRIAFLCLGACCTNQQQARCCPHFGKHTACLRRLSWASGSPFTCTQLLTSGCDQWMRKKAEARRRRVRHKTTHLCQPRLTHTTIA